MRAIYQTVSAAALGLSSLSLVGTAQADAFSITYSDSHYGDPAYVIHYRYGYGSDYCLPRHHHHYDKHHRHHKQRGHHKHDRHHKIHAHYGPPGHRAHRRDDHRGHGEHYGHNAKRDHRGGHDRYGRRDHDGDRFKGRSRSHETYARR
jgi:hypothetical protein